MQPKIKPANFCLRFGSIEPFAQLLEEFMHYRSLRSLFTTNEATLQSILEILLDPQRTCVNELRLIADGTKGRGAVRFGFVDVFVVDGSGNAIIL